LFLEVDFTRLLDKRASWAAPTDPKVAAGGTLNVITFTNIFSLRHLGNAMTAGTHKATVHRAISVDPLSPRRVNIALGLEMLELGHGLGIEQARATP